MHVCFVLSSFYLIVLCLIELSGEEAVAWAGVEDVVDSKLLRRYFSIPWSMEQVIIYVLIHVSFKNRLEDV